MFPIERFLLMMCSNRTYFMHSTAHLCSNHTFLPSTGHWRNPDDSLPSPCWSNSTNTTDNSTSVTYGVVTEDVNSVGYVILFSALVFLFGMLYCMALRAGVVDATSRRNAAIATHCDSFDAMTLKERRHYIDQVLHVKTFINNENSNHSYSEHSNALNEPSSTIAISKQLDDSGDSVTHIEDLSMVGSLDAVSLTDDNPKNDPCCAICLEKFRNHDEISFSHDPLCPHEYHIGCIVEWLLKHSNCPYCRRCYIPAPLAVKTSSIETAEFTVSAGILDEDAIPVSASFRPLAIPRSSSRTFETLDIEMGEGASISNEDQRRSPISEGHHQLTI